MHAGDIASLLWPRTCAGCGAPCEAVVCETCRSALSFRRPALDCAVCGKTILAGEAATGSVAPVCPACLKHHPAFDAGRSAVDYTGPVREIVQSLKYRKAAETAPWIAEIMLGCVAANWPRERFDVVVPIPLHRSHEKKRGYNQAALLASGVAAGLGVPFAPDMLRRIRDTGTQTRLSAEERRSNVAGAFAIGLGQEACAYGKCILLVDDVMTTGSTLSSAASTLRASGASRIFALSFARG